MRGEALFDQANRGGDRLGGIEFGSVEQIGVFGLPQRSGFAAAVARVAGANIGQHILVMGGQAPLQQFANATLRRGLPALR